MITSPSAETLAIVLSQNLLKSLPASGSSADTTRSRSTTARSRGCASAITLYELFINRAFSVKIDITQVAAYWAICSSSKEDSILRPICSDAKILWDERINMVSGEAAVVQGDWRAGTIPALRRSWETSLSKDMIGSDVDLNTSMNKSGLSSFSLMRATRAKTLCGVLIGEALNPSLLAKQTKTKTNDKGMLLLLSDRNK